MRTVSEMLDLISNIAKNDERIRAVQIQGSRTNNKVKTDIFKPFPPTTHKVYNIKPPVDNQFNLSFSFF